MLVVVAVVCLGASGTPVGTQSGHWLDRPLQGWNRPAAELPEAPPLAEAPQRLRERCDVPAPQTAGEQALASRGWIPLKHLDRELVNGGVEVVAGMRAADATCQPAHYNLFVFVDGRYAGTLSPTPMSGRADGAAGPVRFVSDTIAAEFARYGDGDAACCPSARVSVRFRVDRTPEGAAVVPIDVRTTRSY